MAIEFDCPHCGHHYRLKDDLAGKAAACKNCRSKITIPSVSDNTPLPAPAPQVDVEAAAVAALADAPKVEEDPSKKVIEVECKYCSHKWTEPLARAGKNTLCPNEECRQRVKIPELKPDQTADWRQTHTKGPRLAKDNQPQKLEGVQDAADTAQLSAETIREKVIVIEYEPRPMRFWVMVIGGPLLLIAGLGFGLWYAVSSWTTGRQDKVMDTGYDEFVKSDFAKPDAKAPKDVKEEVELFKAVMNYANAEYALRHDEPKKFEEARKRYGEGLTALRSGNSPTRNVLLGELAVFTLAFGGTEQQARDQVRLRWTDDRDLKTPPGAQVFTVHEELRKSLSLLRDTAEFDFRTHLARRLTRELVARGQPGLAEVIPLALFNPPEQPEASAIVALELHRAKAPDPAKIAADLVKRGADLNKIRSASAQTLFVVLKLDKAPRLVNPPGPGGAVSDESRFAYTGIAILEDKPDEALALAQRDGKPEDKLRSLVLCADWMADPSRALDAARPVLDDAGKRPKDVKLSPYALLRLAQIAAEKGKIEQANEFAKAINDEGLRTWALAEVVRIRLAAAPTAKGDEAWFEPLPDKPEKYRAGYAWARLWFARQNARASGNRDAEVKAANAWPMPFSLFGRAGVALGIQDREK